MRLCDLRRLPQLSVSAPFPSAPLRSAVLFHSMLFSPIPFRSLLSGSVPFRSVCFYSTPFHSAPFYSAPPPRPELRVEGGAVPPDRHVTAAAGVGGLGGGGRMGQRDRMFKVLVVGDATVGKTSLVQRYANDSFNRHYKSTVGGERGSGVGLGWGPHRCGCRSSAVLHSSPDALWVRGGPGAAPRRAAPGVKSALRDGASGKVGWGGTPTATALGRFGVRSVSLRVMWV